MRGVSLNSANVNHGAIESESYQEQQENAVPEKDESSLNHPRKAEAFSIGFFNPPSQQMPTNTRPANRTRPSINAHKRNATAPSSGSCPSTKSKVLNSKETAGTGEKDVSTSSSASVDAALEKDVSTSSSASVDA